MIADLREIQRLRFQEGQDLLSRDFRDGATFEARLREWHNRAIHEAHGVRYGLTARPLPGTVSPTAIEVSAGLAYEATGRALFLPTPALVPVPSPWPGGPHLLVLRPGTGGDELAWLPETLWRSCAGVPLSRLGEDDGEPVWDEAFHPPVARPLARPRIGSGTTIAGGTAWKPLSLPGTAALLGVELDVDTRAAGFTRPPCYFAWLQGGIPHAGLKAPAYLPLFPHLTGEKTTGFRLRVLGVSLAGLNQSINPAWMLSQARQRLSVCWLGIQMRTEVTHGNP